MDKLFIDVSQINKMLEERNKRVPSSAIVLHKTFETLSSSFFTPSKTRDIRVIFSNPATILMVGGKKYVSKVHDEEFDEEKGLLMCLAKANGISHAKLKALLKNADRPKTTRN